MPTSRTNVARVRRRPTRSGVVLDRDLIIDAALRLIEAPGGNALTVRRLGVELGADPTAVYRYFRDLDTLLIAIADRLLGDSVAGFEPGEDWVAGLRELGERVHHSMVRHPRLAQLRSTRFTGGPNELRADDIGIGLLLRAGFGPDDAVRHYRDFIDAVLALAAMDAAELTPDQQRFEDEALAGAYASITAELYPHLAAVRVHLPQVTSSAYPGVVDKLLDALAALSIPDRPMSDRGR